MADTLELLVFMPMNGDHLDMAAALSWRGFPPTASWGSPLVADIDLGDWECKDLPSLPSGPGLWLLRWEWTPTHEDGFDTVQYADTCEWSRPTMEELAVLGALPTAARSEGAGEVTEEMVSRAWKALESLHKVETHDESCHPPYQYPVPHINGVDYEDVRAALTAARNTEGATDE